MPYVAGAAEMPEAMGLLFQKALAVGTNGAVSVLLSCREFLV